MRFFPSKRNSAFTLLEVILAVALATGILIAMMLFYRQAADLRTQLLLETDRLTNIRLVLDRITSDLRSACSDNESLLGFSGDTASLQFVRLELPSPSAWSKTEATHPTLAQTDLRIVSYSTQSALDGTNLVLSGLARTERPLAPPRMLQESSRKSNPTEGDTTSKLSPELLTDAIRYLRFRYWDGTQWLDSWNDVELPHGVEVSLGTEPFPEEAAPGDYLPDVFRRVIYLPAHSWSTASIIAPDSAEPSTTTVTP
jgi:type II secretory pathway pseudopilin PulG